MAGTAIHVYLLIMIVFGCFIMYFFTFDTSRRKASEVIIAIGSRTVNSKAADKINWHLGHIGFPSGVSLLITFKM